MSESIWYPSTTPGGSEAIDTYTSTTRVTLGTLILVDVAGVISGIAVYRSNTAANTTMEVGLYTGDNTNGWTLAATKTSVVDTSVGWKVILFDSPVSVAANSAVYACHLLHTDASNQVYYMAQSGYFTTDPNTFYPSAGGSVKAANSSGNGGNIYQADFYNGLYSEGTSLTRPVNSFNQTNYFVDVIYGPAGGSGSQTMTAAQGSFTKTGSATLLTAARKLTAAQGSFTRTGEPATLRRARKLPAALGSFGLTGTTTLFAYQGTTITNPVMSVASTSYTLAPQTIGLRRALLGTSSTGYFRATVQALGLGQPRSVTHDLGTFALTGIAADFTLVRKPQTSGATDFNPDVAEYIEEAFERCGLEVRTGYDARTARRSLNLLLAEWANRGLNQWTMESVSLSVKAGVDNYSLGQEVIDLTAAVIRADTYDRALNRISREDWIKRPIKSMVGTPLQFYVDRQINPSLQIWPVPDKDYTVLIDKIVRMDVALNSRQTVDVPFRFYPCLAAGLAYYLSIKKAPDRTAMLKQLYEEEFSRAATEDRDRASFFILPARGRMR